MNAFKKLNLNGALSSDSSSLHVMARLLVLAVAVGAFVLSFDALTDLARQAGIREAFAPVWALVVDGFIFVATLAVFALKGRGKTTIAYVWTCLGLFVLLSIIGNAWHAVISKDHQALPVEAAIGVTAVPPLALFLAIHLLIIMLSPTKEQKAEMERQKKRAERLRAIEERELEKIEKDNIRKNARESQAAQLTYSSTPAPKPTPKAPTRPAEAPKPLNHPVAPKPAESSAGASTVPPATVSEVTDTLEVPAGNEPAEPAPVNIYTPTTGDGFAYIEGLATEPFEGATMSEQAAYYEYMRALTSGEKPPSGATIAAWIGRGERTGQKLVKRFREANGLT